MAKEEAKMKTVEGKYLEYMNKPLVREGDTICYGDMNEKYIMIMEIISYREGKEQAKGKSLPEKIMLQIIDSKDPNHIIRQGSFIGLHEAFSMGLVWLDNALKQS